MKQTLIILGVAVGLFSCQSEVEKLESEKEALQSSISEDTKRLDEVTRLLDSLKNGAEIDYPDVTVASVNEGQFEHYITVQGIVASDEIVQVVPEMGGMITSLPVKKKEGQLVNKGELLASIDNSIISKNVQELQEQIDLAKYMFEKQQSLYEKGVGTEFDLKQAEAQYKSLLKSKESLKTQQGKYNIYAPFTGIVEKVDAVQGQMAGPQTPIAMIVGLSDKKIKANISEAYLAYLNKGAKVSAEFAALKQTFEDLKVSRIGSFVDPSSRTIQVEVQLPQSEKLVPNLTSTVKIRDYVDSAALIIPSKVVLKGANSSSYVYVTKLDTEASNDSIQRFNVEKRNVELGMTYDGNVIVKSGLEKGEQVVERGKSEVYEGIVVEVVEE
ncbi:efflux RND transporter periplasmic adaptor subunit [Parvicella tangerina]|uniref:Multidrug resistance protein MdtA n=1 Tax=Parvicella tangerina TaxID=2829795 RepID=A0A916NQ65_9FLAO|nr:efflux RND transporter periplasmic adaptor subunit [Parvicella tangerina]CAG5078398.1 Multidrug resistance protein MdtA [Parvicella tangerina]